MEYRGQYFLQKVNGKFYGLSKTEDDSSMAFSREDLVGRPRLL